MSGSRHAMMNAVRVRKENQVISAEEQNALIRFNRTEKVKKEAEIIGKFKEMIQKKF